MASLQDFDKMAAAYYAAHPPAEGVGPVYADPQAEVSGYAQAPGFQQAYDAYAQYRTDTGQGWLDSLTPQQRAEYNALHQQLVDANAKKARRGAVIAMSVPLLAAGAGALGAFGAAGEGGMGAGALGGATSFPVYSPALPVLTDIPGGLTAGLGAAGRRNHPHPARQSHRRHLAAAPQRRAPARRRWRTLRGRCARTGPLCRGVGHRPQRGTHAGRGPAAPPVALRRASIAARQTVSSTKIHQIRGFFAATAI